MLVEYLQIAMHGILRDVLIILGRFSWSSNIVK